MASYCKLKSIEVTKIMPVTFPINLESKDFTSQMCKFNGHFKNFSKDSRNIWILKPSGFNRGRGIHVFNDILRLRTLLNEAQNTVQAKTKPIFAKKTSNSLKFVIQKYIEDPMLIEGRKFDIRVWVLVTQEFDCFMFTQGYLRTSCELFTLNDESLNSDFVHLTNNAIQKEAKTYGQFEAGNQLSFE